MIPGALGGLVIGLAVFIVAGVGVAGGALLALRLTRRTGMVRVLLAYAAGTLLGAALLRLLPEAGEALPMHTVGALALSAILASFVLERWVLWRHCHEEECPTHRVAGYVILIGDGLHNAVDGVVLGAATAADPWLGLTVAVALLAHEVPQELGDFVLLLDGGLTPRRALALNLVSSASIVPGTLVGWLMGGASHQLAAGALGLAAGSFIYVALSDLLPSLSRHTEASAGGRGGLGSMAPLLAGIGTAWLSGALVV